MASADIHKGLHNETAAYHCFINVIIQSLWHLLPFRHRLISLDYSHRHKAEPCVFCALRSIFTQYEHSESVIIPPDALRLALHEVDSKDGGVRFAIGAQGDAEEALDEILQWLHSDHVSGDVKPGQSGADVTCVPPCISHAVFGAQCMDVRVCRCGATSDPDSSTSFLYRVYVSDLLATLSSSRMSFASVLKTIYRAQSYSCPNSALSPTAQPCRGPAQIDRWLLSSPIVFTLMLAWQPEVSRPDIERICSSLPSTLRLTDFLRHTSSDVDGVSLVYELQGAVCYYGRHYLAFFWSHAYGEWLLFDDRRVVLVGDWPELCRRAVAGKLQPILVFYQQPGGAEEMHSPRELARSMQTEWSRRQDEEEQKAGRERAKGRRMSVDSLQPATAAPPLPTTPPPRTSISPSPSASLSQFGYGASQTPSHPSSSSSSPTRQSASSLSRGSSVRVSGPSESPLNVEDDVFFGLQPFSYTSTRIGGTKRR